MRGTLIPLAGIGDQGGETMLEGGGARGEKATEAPAGEGDWEFRSAPRL
jgi:hypothetical protein